MNTLYPEETVNQIWTWTMRELTSASNSYSVEAYPVDAVDGAAKQSETEAETSDWQAASA